MDAVRTKVLQLALELENDVGDIDSVIAKGDTEKVAPIVQQVFNTVVYGGTALLGSQAGGSINVIDRQLIVAGDFRSLESQLRATGLEPSQIETLKGNCRSTRSSCAQRKGSWPCHTSLDYEGRETLRARRGQSSN